MGLWFRSVGFGAMQTSTGRATNVGCEPKLTDTAQCMNAYILEG